MSDEKPKKPAKRKLTVKQIKFIKEFKKSGNQSEAALKAGYSVRQSAHDVLANPVVKSRLEKFYDTLEKVGATDEAAATVIKEGFTAEKVISAYVHKSGPKGLAGDVENPDADERDNDFVNVPDHPSRLKAAELYCKIKRHIGADNTPTTAIGVSGNVMIFLQDPNDASRNTAPKEAGLLLPAQ